MFDWILNTHLSLKIKLCQGFNHLLRKAVKWSDHFLIVRNKGSKLLSLLEACMKSVFCSNTVLEVWEIFITKL